MVKVFGNFIHDTIICRVQLSFGSAIVKIYPFTILCWVNEDKKTFNNQIFPAHRTLYVPQLLKKKIII